MKFLKILANNFFLFASIFFLAFIPLYPKLPIIGLSHTWVYIRLEDFFITITLFAWIVQLIRKKVSFKTPLTIPIIIFWVIGLISTAYAVFFIFPYIANVFPSVALFFYLRHIEYLSLFFIGFSAIKNNNNIVKITAGLVVTVLTVVFYGIGQRLWGFPAFLTMNEEFAKGIPLRLSQAARIPSTFAGHYDLAAYLVMIIPLIGSMIFGFKNIYVKLILLLTGISGLVLLLMTASRVSFTVYLLGVIFMLILQKKKIFILPVIIGSILILNSFQGMTQRFGSTISQVDVVVDARTGKTIGIAKEQAKKQVVIEEQQSTGESLPQGSGYINIPSETSQKTITQVVYKRSKLEAGKQTTQVTNIEGEFAIKRMLAYDLSFTTRFQGEWPRALAAFKRNILLGSGYSSISSATDNNYLRILGETGALGFSSFILIFLVIWIFIKNVLPDVDSQLSKSFIFGLIAGIFSLALNGILIDVFEASKVAFVLWLLIGIMIGLLNLYKKKEINYIEELKKALTSVPAVIIYLLIISFSALSMMVGNFFTADDFTWLRWAADCKKIILTSGLTKCEPLKNTFMGYFTNSDGFFYRPGTKVYFYIMYTLFWLNQLGYHVVSILIHFAVSAVVFLLSKKIINSKFFAFLTALFFLILGAHSESIFWISTSGHLISAGLILLALLFYIYWKENKKIIYFIFSLLFVFTAPLFHEMGIISPVIILAYEIISGSKNIKKILNINNLLYFLSIPVYLSMRAISGSHWFNGDYSYKLSNLIYNFFGNIAGYIGFTFLGSRFLPYYEQLRISGRENPVIVLFVLIVVLIIAFLVYKLFKSKFEKDAKIILLGLSIFIISLLPFLGLGNIAPRYVYLPSFGALLLLILILKKTFTRINSLNRYFGILFMLIIIIIFSIFNLSELQRINNDWAKAGEITNNILIDFNSNYQAKRTPQNPVFYFVNTPIRTGEAWIFPVGLKDALWFTFQNEYLTVNQSKSLQIALDSADASASARVYEFNPDGSLEEVIKTINTIPVPNNAK